MHISDLNECLSELPEISVLDTFRPRISESAVRWTGEDAIDSVSANAVGPIFVDDHGIEYVVSPPEAKPLEMPTVHGRHESCSHFETRPLDTKVCRVSRPNKTIRFQDMTRSCDVPADIRRALLAFVSTQPFGKVA